MNVTDQERWRELKRSHARNMIIMQDRTVLDPMAVIGPRFRLQHRFVGIDRCVDGGIAVSVDTDLPALIMGIPNSIGKLLRRVVERAAAVGIQIGEALKAGAALVRAVGPRLGRRHCACAGRSDLAAAFHH